MSKHGAKLLRRLTREWTKNRYHYYVPLSADFCLQIRELIDENEKIPHFSLDIMLKAMHDRSLI